MSANDYQIGGKHYKTKYEHWDLVLKLGMGYFDGQAVKYLTRWQNKNGVEDLEKAPHYLWKLIENFDKRPKRSLDYTVVHDELAQYAVANNMSPLEASIASDIICGAANPDHGQATIFMQRAIDMLEMMVAKAKGPAPLEDSNKHGERA